MWVNSQNCLKDQVGCPASILVIKVGRMTRELSSLEKQAADALRRARRLPLGPNRDALRLTFSETIIGPMVKSRASRYSAAAPLHFSRADYLRWLGLLLIVLPLANSAGETSGLLFGESQRSQPLRPGRQTAIDDTNSRSSTRRPYKPSCLRRASRSSSNSRTL